MKFHRLLFLLFLLFVDASLAQNTSISIIVNKDNPVAKLTPNEVRLYWLKKMKSHWPESAATIKPVDHKEQCAEQQIFYWKILNMTTDDVETYFVTRQYQDAQKPQDKLTNDKDIIDFVGKEAGAIGYVNTNSITPDVKSHVKVVYMITN